MKRVKEYLTVPQMVESLRQSMPEADIKGHTIHNAVRRKELGGIAQRIGHLVVFHTKDIPAVQAFFKA